MTSWISLLITAISILNVIIIGSYMSIKLILKSRSQRKKSLIVLTRFILLFQAALISLSLTFLLSQDLILKGILYIIAIISLLWMLYELNTFERLVYKSKMVKKETIRNGILFILSSIFVLLPQNYWFLTNFDQLPEGRISLQPISFILLIVLTVYFTIGTAIRSGKAIKNILDPFLNKTLRLINQGFKVLALIIPFFVINGLVFVIEMDLDTAKMIIEICNISLVIIGLISINLFYIGLTLPNFMYKNLYKQYSPMWEKSMDKQEHRVRFERELKKLQETFFD